MVVQPKFNEEFKQIFIPVSFYLVYRFKWAFLMIIPLLLWFLLKKAMHYLKLDGNRL